jgi:DNA gyrase subunit A
MSEVQQVPLHAAARERYLNYAMSVITARALPDVRDGLKPVQRRILYTMYHELSLHPTGRYRKSAAVVGEVMGKYHPHGDQSIYDALVRMAQWFSLRDPLVDPQGNFGSLDGDPPAAMRYTECKLSAIAEELLQELDKDTVDVRPTYDGQREEPVVLPAQFPQLLVNGVEGIAVGLATRIPPHNLGEVIDGAVALIDGVASSVSDLLAIIPGPDFPTGGRILTDRHEMLKIYEEGHGSIRVQGETTVETEGRRTRLIITSLPYGTNKSKLIERIGADVEEKRLPQVVDVRDESTDDVRIVLELKAGVDPDAVVAWLYKRTPLESTFPVSMTALVPVEGALPAPVRLDLKAALDHWLDFRYATIRRRYEYDLALLRKRIHMLEGFAIVLVDIDELVRLIRSSDGKKDAARLLMARWPLDEVQTDAILEMQLYKLSRLEIQIILDELDEKRAEASGIVELLSSEARLWGQVRHELLRLKGEYATPRRTMLSAGAVHVPTFNEEAYRIHEDTWLVVTREGWVKRQSSFTDVSKIRTRENDSIGWLLKAGTTTAVTFFGSDGTAWTTKVGEVPATTGYGVPLSKLFVVGDGVGLVGVALHDPSEWASRPADPAPNPEDPPAPHLVGLTRHGRIVRLAFEAFAEPSTRTGRRYARVDDADGVLSVEISLGGEIVSVASKEGNVLLFPVKEANVLRGAGKGTTAITLKESDEVVAWCLADTEAQGVRVTASTGRTIDVTVAELDLGHRAGRGRSLFRRAEITGWERTPVIRLGDRQPASDGGEE